MSQSVVKTPIRVNWQEDGSAVIMARITNRPTIRGAEGTPLVRNDINALALWVFDVTNEEVPNDGNATVVSDFNGITLDKTAVIFNTLQGWDEDEDGHNFRYTLTPVAFPGPRVYRVEVRVTLASGIVGWMKWQGYADSVCAT